MTPLFLAMIADPTSRLAARGAALPLLSFIGSGALVGGPLSALRTRRSDR